MNATVCFTGIAGDGWFDGSCRLGAWPRVRAQMEAGGVELVGVWLAGSLV